MIWENTTGERNSVEVLAGLAVTAVGRPPFQLAPTGVRLAGTPQETQNQLSAIVDPKVEFCGQKHFFCGVAKKFGCQVCAGN